MGQRKSILCRILHSGYDVLVNHQWIIQVKDIFEKPFKCSLLFQTYFCLRFFSKDFFLKCATKTRLFKKICQFNISFTIFDQRNVWLTAYIFLNQLRLLLWSRSLLECNTWKQPTEEFFKEFFLLEILQNS